MRSAIGIYCVACGEKGLSDCGNGDTCKCLSCGQRWSLEQLTKLCWKFEEKDAKIAELQKSNDALLESAHKELAEANKTNERWKTVVSDLKMTEWEWDQHSLKSALRELTRIFKLDTGCKLSDLLDAAEKQLAAREWMPISEAPRDGTEVDLWFDKGAGNKGFRITDCAWSADGWYSKACVNYAGHEKRLDSYGPIKWMLPPEPKGET